MPIYNYSARDDRGNKIKGMVEADNEKEAVTLIRDRSLFLIGLSKKENKLSFLSPAKLSKISFNDIVNFTRQLSTMMTAGLQIQEALDLLRVQSTNPAFTDMLVKISRDIQSGGNLTTTLEKYPQHFSTTYIALIRAGESSGTLDMVLNRLADNLEKDQEFSATVKGAMVYPAIIFIVMIIVFIILMTAVVPKLTELFSQFGSDLPLQTRILQWVSDFFVKFWWLVVIIGVGGWTLFLKWKKTISGRHIWDAIVLKLPIFGPLSKQIILVEFTRTLGMLVGSGVHILDSLNIMVKSVDNIHYQEAIQDIAKKVEKGLPLGQLFAQYPMFPPILAQMVRVGEETGKMDESLIKISTYFERESDHTVKTLTTALEPVIMIILAVGVGFIVFSIITPIYNLTSQFK